jgi:hypothetical protein
LLYFLPQKAKLVAVQRLGSRGRSVSGAAWLWYGAELALSAWDVKLPSLGITGAVDFLPLVAGGVPRLPLFARASGPARGWPADGTLWRKRAGSRSHRQTGGGVTWNR